MTVQAYIFLICLSDYNNNVMNSYLIDLISLEVFFSHLLSYVSNSNVNCCCLFSAFDNELEYDELL